LNYKIQILYKDFQDAMAGWIKQGRATSDSNRAPARLPMFGSYVLPNVNSRREKKEKKK
jgi:hypothetical protein